MKRFVWILASVILLASCMGEEERLVARIADEKLYEKDVVKLLPKDLAPADSARMVEQYVETWAKSRLLLRKAEQMLRREDKDISAEVEDFRRSLLSFRYEKQYVENRIDTVVTQEQLEEYYKANSVNFKYDYPVARGRVIIISRKSPYYQTVKKGYTTLDDEKVSELADLCRSFAERYDDFQDAYIPLSTVSRILGMDVASCQLIWPDAANRGYIKEEDGKAIFVFLYDICPAGRITPLEYNQERIADAIISKRKQQILARLERDLLDDALKNNILIVY